VKTQERNASAPPRYRRLTGVDSFMLGLDRGSLYNQTLKIAILDPSTDPEGWSFDRYRAVLLQTHLHPGSLWAQRYLRTPLGLHQPIWVDDPDFELDAHVRRVACPAPGGMPELCAVIEQISAQPLEHNRPLWQVWVVEGLEGGRVALVGLVHHAYTDGAGASRIIEDLTSASPTEISVRTPPEWNPPPLPTRRQLIAWALRDLPPVLRTIPSALAAMRRRRRLESVPIENRPSAQDRRQPQPFTGSLTRTRRFACASFPLEHLREVRGALGGTVNDVFLSCVAGSVREFLAGRETPPARPVIGSIAFLNKPVGDRPEPWGNFSSADDVWLHADIADPVERLAAVRVSAQATKDHFKAVASADPYLVLFDLMPGWAMRALLRFDERTGGRFTPAYDVVMSNVPGPATTSYFGRWRVEHLFSTGQLVHGFTLNVTAWSYDGQFNVCVLTGSPRIDDAWEFIDGFRASLDELRTIAGRASAPVATGGTSA